MTIFRSALRSLFLFLLSTHWATPTLTLASATTTIPNEITLGTTIVAVKFDQGVIVAADSRTSQGDSVVAHRWATKLCIATPYVTIARAGSAAATQHVLETWRKQRRHNSAAAPVVIDVTRVAHWMRRMVREQHGHDDEVSMSFLIAGIDTRHCLPRIYCLSASGALVEEATARYACSGSGSSFAMAYLQEQQQQSSADEAWQEEEALEHCRRAIEHAAYRDKSSGGCVRYRIVRCKSDTEEDGDATSTDICTVPLRSVASTSISTATSTSGTNKLPGFAAPQRRPFSMVKKSKSVV